MKTDSFTKVLLVLIALFLGVIALRPFLQPELAVGSPGGKFDYVQAWETSISTVGVGSREGLLINNSIIFDSRTGDLWGYTREALNGKKNPEYLGTVTDLGKPFSQRK